MDLGLRNARLNWRQQERSHLMENMLYNDLIRRGYSVDVGVVELDRVVNSKRQQSQYEIDFVVNTGNNKVYIQYKFNKVGVGGGLSVESISLDVNYVDGKNNIIPDCFWNKGILYKGSFQISTFR